MKTINALMLSLAALTIAGCSQNEVTEISPDAHPQVDSVCTREYQPEVWT